MSEAKSDPGKAQRTAVMLCRRIGAAPDGPIGQRLVEACGQMTPSELDAVSCAAAAPVIVGEGANGNGILKRLFDQATNRETYFFRDRGQLQLLRELLAEQGAGSAPSIWSAGCATGEEAYSVAILCAGHPFLTHASILGTDLSEAALVVAEGAVYRTGAMSSCRGVTRNDERYLPPHGVADRCVAPALRARVRFRPHNVLDRAPQEAPFDAILCRNVMIYMEAAARAECLAALDAALKPGGILVIGPGDAAPPVDPGARGYRAVFRNNALVFVKEPTHAR